MHVHSHTYTHTHTQLTLIGASLSEPHTSELSGMSVIFTKIYEEIRINGRVCKHLRLKRIKPDYLQVLPIITRRITTLVYSRSI